MSRAAILPAAALLIILSAGCAVAPHPVAVPFGGGSIHVDDGGRGGMPIVFIHGNGGSSEQWQAQLDHFRTAGTRAVAIDLPGFGRSTTPSDGDLSLPAMASAIVAAVDSIGLRRFVIVGHSYAGAVVATYAAAHPEKVAGVVYLDAAAGAIHLTDQQKTQFAAALAADKMRVVRAWFAPMLKGSTPRVEEQVFASVEKTPTPSLIAALTSLSDYDARRLVNAYSGPKLAIVAADLETPASFQKQFPDITAVRVSNAGHWLMLDKPAEVNAAIDRFVGQISR